MDPTASMAADISAPTRRLPCLVVLAGRERGRAILLKPGRQVVGSGPDADLELADRGVSRRHAQLLLRAGRVELQDLGSTNGTWCNGRQITRCRLSDGDHLQLGACRLAFRLSLPEEDRLLRQLYRRATRDALTGLLNRACLEDRLEREVRHHQRYRRGLALVMLDLDHFKRINDTFGHPAGDQVLRAVAEALRGCLRASDLAGRVGGEEFLLVLPEADQPQAARIAEKVRSAIAALDLALSGRPVHLTASCGVSASGKSETDARALWNLADQACYQAKRAGRDRVVGANSSGQPR